MLKPLTGLLLLLGSTALFATNIEYGNGDFELKADFDGYSTKLHNDISTYSLVEHHRNLFNSSWFYKYNFTWYTSKTLQKVTDTIANAVPSGFSSYDYKLKGLDINAVLGKDIYHKNKSNFIGLGLLVGLSTPIIKGLDNSSNSSSSKHSNTDILSYKIGPSISVGWNQNKYIMFYASAAYAYQMLRVKNSNLNLSTQLNGTFQKYDAGVKIQPFSMNYHTKYMTFNPDIYATFGYRYTHWDLDNMAINFDNTNLSLNNVHFTTTASVYYFGIGYDFF